MRSPEVRVEVSGFVDVGHLVSNMTALVVGLYREAALEPPNPFLFTEAEQQRLVAGLRRGTPKPGGLAMDAMPAQLLAFDKSGRSIDAQGFLHVEVSNISKATVNPYFGKEIPNWEGLGLEPDRIYQLYRDPGELAKAASTFNSLPLLAKHIPVSAEDPQKDSIVGSTGTDAQFHAPYLQNALVVWDAEAIKGIESREKVELSCSYRYVAEMVPGVVEGIRYDGRMTEIQGNHVALVEVGRAGPDVVVGDRALGKDPNEGARRASARLGADQQPKKEGHMAMNRKLTPRGHAVKGALAAYLRPKLAADAALKTAGTITALLKELPEGKTATIAGAVHAAAGKQLAKDASLDKDDLVDLLESLEDEDEDVAEDEDDAEDKAAKDKKAKDKAAKDKAAKDKEEEEAKAKAEEEAKKKPTMDADAIRAQLQQDFQALREAEKSVEPVVGAVAAMDSAAAVYRFAFDAQKIDVKDVPDSGLKAMWDAFVKMRPATPHVAQDSAPVGSSKSFAERHPNAVIPRRA